MKILIATFDHSYYLWQCLVQINNFMKYGYDEELIYIISTSNPSNELKKLMNNPKIKAKFFLYPDTRNGHTYASSLRPHILEKFYLEYPDMNNETVFYTDPDVLFTKKLDLDKFDIDEKWYVSDTRSYLDSKYIKSKSEKLFKEMCDIVNVPTHLVESYDKHAGGAQYILKNIDANFWKKCYIDMENLYLHMKKTENIYNPEHPIQSWTADMWAVFWNGLYFGHVVNIDKDLDFSWATDNIKRWNDTYIFHNAGVPGFSETYFSKVMHQKSPFNKEIKTETDNCSFKYLEEIKDTEKNFKDILW